MRLWSLDLFFRRLADRIPGARLLPRAEFFSVLLREETPASAVAAGLAGLRGGGEGGSVAAAAAASAQPLDFSDEEIDRHLAWLRRGVLHMEKPSGE